MFLAEVMTVIAQFVSIILYSSSKSTLPFAINHHFVRIDDEYYSSYSYFTQLAIIFPKKKN
jgi:hypothetical protein